MACRLAISSMSLGRCYAGHAFAHKLDMAKKYGYQGIEIFYEDLVDMAEHLSSSSAAEVGGAAPTATAQVEAAREIRQMCASRGLEIIALQPFMHYEGLVDRTQHKARIQELQLWIKLAHALGTDLILVPSTFLPADQVTDDIELIVEDFGELADLGAQASPVVRFAHESLAWGTRTDTWERCWEVVKRVNRPNFGLCLDTFNIAARIYADPSSPTGKVPNADEAVRASMARLARDVDIGKVFFVQVVDAERLQAPLVEGHPFYNAQQPARMSWSRNCRLFYRERDYGAYLPTQEIASAIFQDLGFRGWVSLELFNRRMSDEGAEVPDELARRGAASWARLSRDMGWSARKDAAPTPGMRIVASL